ncbi:MAG: hypothetical protein WHS64_05460 [Fervidobacterium sp.]|uniref:Uncharacterized protein n=1 Tax=Fervidobacterium gondwanense DSM 13020 TaxID=1121883 RepID=A0A1M7SJH2_FERGO|nr:hypothetical protein [Fervidobacterium gondwanense]UXF01585.1 hypothetical protein IB67_08660 [Fervidobacterium riparium]SHN58602.1 hypothetical protein SAMN02745226_00948 [Fervidobacterium gondwanense DSM 13020]
MKIYFDPNFIFTELLDYYAPVIVDLNGRLYIDLHSFNIVNLLGRKPRNIYQGTLKDWFFNIYEYDEDINLDIENLLPFTAENFDKFKISNTLSIEHVKYTNESSKFFLKVENSLNNLECVVSLSNEYLIKNIEIFSDKYFEFVLQILVGILIKELLSKHNISSTFTHPFIFLINFAGSKYEEAYEILQRLRKINENLSVKIQIMYEFFKKEKFQLGKIIENTEIGSFTRTIYKYGNIEDLINDLTAVLDTLIKLMDLISPENA